MPLAFLKLPLQSSAIAPILPASLEMWCGSRRTMSPTVPGRHRDLQPHPSSSPMRGHLARAPCPSATPGLLVQVQRSPLLACHHLLPCRLHPVLHPRWGAALISFGLLFRLQVPFRLGRRLQLLPKPARCLLSPHCCQARHTARRLTSSQPATATAPKPCSCLRRSPPMLARQISAPNTPAHEDVWHRIAARCTSSQGAALYQQISLWHLAELVPELKRLPNRVLGKLSRSQAHHPMA
mmetsp:Transcript_49794/g.118711  ORF Transcript_49794/g.118711 Transcript_49794/m.118711 type:complete len:238 (+) Transcript_49794:426-1139(+)